MMRKMFAGSTSQSLPIFVQNATVGGGYAGLLFNSAGLAGEYRRKGQGSWTSISLATMTLGTWVNGGWISDGALAGAYEIGIPNAALAAGAEWVEIRFYGATSMSPVLIFIELDAVNYQSPNSFVTGINALAPPTNWNLETIDPSGRVTLSPAGLDSITIEAGMNPRQALSIIGASVAGLGGTTSNLYKGMGVATTRITFVDAGGERSVVTLTPPA